MTWNRIKRESGLGIFSSNRRWMLICLACLGFLTYSVIRLNVETPYGIVVNDTPGNSVISHKRRSSPEVPPPDTKVTMVTKVVLVAYYRGGSSFLGELFNQNPDAFYWFEPLAHPAFHLSRQLRVPLDEFQVMSNGSIRNLSMSMMRDMTGTILDILNCNLERLRRPILKHYFLTKWKKSLKGLPYANCLEQYPADSVFAVPTCLPWLVEACRASTLRAVKTIRLPAYLAEELAWQDPEIQFVYYHRDPRAMLVSRSKFKGYLDWGRPGDVETQSVRQCSLSMHDHTGFKTFTEGHYRPLVVRYEDYAVNPVGIAQTVYTYLGKRLPQIVKDWLVKHTTSKTSNGLLGTTRNSNETASRWRRAVSQEASSIFLKNCEKVLRAQGYL